MAVPNWVPITISILSAAIAAVSAGYTILFHQDDLRLVLGDALNVTRNGKDFTLEREQKLTFINSGNRPAVISDVYAELVLSRGTGDEQSHARKRYRSRKASS